MTLAKARLIAKDAGVPNIEFMFNPTELAFERIVETSENPGARSQDKGQAKVSFAVIISYKVTISKIVFDTYETGENVVTKYLEPFRKAVHFPDDKGVFSTPSDSQDQSGGNAKKERTPLYTFVWGQNTHLRSCFVERLSYKLTLFLPDGTPVRAVIDNLSLKEVAEPKPDNPMQAIQPSPTARQKDTMKNRQKKSSNQSATPPSSQSSRRRK
jgi:hypothetical protein